MLSVFQAKASRINRISGVCAGTDEWYQLLNDGTRELMARGQWWNTVRRMHGCVFNNCITWPRQVGTVLAINRCGHSIPPKNHWAEFDAVLPEDVRNHMTFGLAAGCRCWGNIEAIDFNTTPVFNQPPCLNDRLLRFYPTHQADVGKTITLFGIDSNGQTIQSARTDGTFLDGVVLTLAIPYVQTTMLVRRVDRVIKDMTQGTVFGYQFDGQTQYPLSAWEPSETLPEYRQSRIVSGWVNQSNSNHCCITPQITALVKLQFIPALRDEDLVLIDNLDALAIAMQSIKQSDAYDHEGAEIAMQRAVHTLNLDLRQKLPLDSIPAKVHHQGSAKLNRVRVGKII